MKMFLYLTAVFIPLSVSNARVLDKPASQTVCDGSDLILDFTFDNEEQLNAAVWRKGETTVLQKLGENPATVENAFRNKFVHVNNGKIKLLDAKLVDEGTYKLTVSYKPSSLLPADEGSVHVAVHEPPVLPNSSIISESDEMVCSTPDLGSPAVSVQIKIDNVLQQSARATISSQQTIDCCVTGEAVTCLIINTGHQTTYCHNVQAAVVTTEAPKTADTQGGPKEGLDGGEIAGIVVGVVVPLVILVVVGVYFYRKS